MKNEPIFPLFLLLHKTKKLENHLNFFSTIENILHLSQYKNLYIITDREPSIVRAIEKSSLIHFYCTNHLKTDVKTWLNKNNFEKSVKSKVKIITHHLINSKSIEKFENIWINFVENEKKFSENEKIMDYMNNQILPDIKNNIEKDVEGIFKEKLPTNNMSESYNFVIKQATEWKQNSMDKMCMIFYYLQTYNIREISRAMRGLGNYYCKDDLPKKFNIKEQEHVFDYEKIIEKISEEYESEKFQVSENNSVEILAKQALEKSFVSHNSSIGCFTIRDFTIKNKCYVVFLHPEPTCTCGSKVECFHMICARLSINEKTDLKPKFNISEMTKKSKTKKSIKKSDETDVKFIEFKKSQDRVYKIDLKIYLENSLKIKTKNPNEKINKKNDEEILNNIFDWDVFKNGNYLIIQPYEDLNEGKWLKDDTIFIAIESFIKYYDANEFVSIFHPDIITMIIGKKYKNIFNYSNANFMLNKQLIFINLYGDNFGFKI